MATFVLIHGAGGRASSWDLVAPELRAAGHAAFVSGAGPSLLVLCPRPAARAALADAADALIGAGAEGWRVRQLELARDGARGG